MAISGSVLPYLEVSHYAPNYVLEIDGFSDRYYSRIAPSAASPYTYYAGLVSVGVTSEEIDLETGISKGRGCKLIIADTVQNGAIAKLCKVGPKGSARFATLATTLAHASANIDVVADRDVTAWSVAPIWIGQECFLPASIAGSTFQNCTRGYYGSQIQRHVVNATQAWAPPITDSCVAWRTRRARLLMGSISTDGSVATSSYIELVSGFIDSTPETDGNSVIITIAPWTAALGIELGHDSDVTGLLRGWHYFTAGVASQVRNQHTMPAQAYRGQVHANSPAAAAALNAHGAGTTIANDGDHSDIFDRTLANYADGTPHPRAGALWIPSNNVDTVAAYNNGPPTFFTMTNNLGTAVGVGQRVYSVEGSETTVYDIVAASVSSVSVAGTTAIKVWPGQVLRELNGALDITVHTGASGRWLNVQVHDMAELRDGTVGPAVSASANCTRHVTPIYLTWTPRKSDLWMLDMHSPDSAHYYRPVGDEFGASIRRPDLFRWRQPEMVVLARETVVVGAVLPRDYFPIRPIPDAFYQTHEPIILVRDNVLGDTGDLSPTRWVRFDFVPESPDLYDVSGESGRVSTYCRIENVTAQTDPTSGSTIGYRFRILSDDRPRVLPFGVYDGLEEPRIVPISYWRKHGPTRIVGEILMSGAGNGFNSADYDVQPVGLNLSTNEVESVGLRFFPVPDSLNKWTLESGPGASFVEIVKGILAALQAGVVHRLNPTDGRRRLTLWSMSLPNKFDSIATFGADDWDVAAPPVSTTDDRVKARYEFRLNWDPTSGRYLNKVVYVDADSRAAHGEVGDETIELRGLTIDTNDPAAQQSVLRPIWGQRRAAFGHPRRMLELTVPWYRAARLYAGAVVTLSTEAPGALDYDGSALASETIARIERIEADPSNARARLTAVTYGANTSGWAPTAALSSLNAGRTIGTYAANTYTQTTHPVTGGAQIDLRYLNSDGTYTNYFAQGDTITVIPFGNYAARVSRTISAIDYATREITYSSALPAGFAGVAHTIRTADYGSATATIQEYAYIAAEPPTPPTLGAGNDPAYVYS